MKQKQSFLANFVITIMSISAGFTIVSYLFLTWTNKRIPTDLIAFFGSLSGGTVISELFKLTGLKQEINVKLSSVDYALMGLALVMMAAVINYNLLIWAEREIPSQMVATIGSMITIVFSGTTFRNSNTANTDRSTRTNKQD